MVDTLVRNVVVSTGSEDLTRLRAYLITRVSQDMDGLPAQPENMPQAVKVLIADTLERMGVRLAEPAHSRLLREVTDELIGYGPLQPFLDDPLVNEIMANGPHLIYIEHAGAAARRRRAPFPERERFAKLKSGGALDSPATAAAKVLAYLDRADFGHKSVAVVRDA